MSSSTHETKRAIVKAIEGLGGEAKQMDIARAMGPEWIRGGMYSRLRQTMRQLEKDHVLKTSHRGLYSIHPTFHARGFDVRDLTVRQIEEFLIERCGRAGTGEIHAAVGVREIADGARDTEHKRVTLALAKTPEKFRRLSPGVWALTPEACQRLPLLGWWAEKELDSAEREGFFERVGEAFAEARDGSGLDVETVTVEPDIRAALTVMANAAPDAKSEFLADMRRDVRAELQAKGIDDEYVVTLRVHDREDAMLPVYVLLAFEAGDFRLHLTGTPEFYRGLAALYRVDAARLSRGEVIGLLSPRGEASGAKLTASSRPVSQM
jgi:hypothetical protein